MPLNFRTAPLQPPRYAPPSPSCPCEASGASQVVVQQASAGLLVTSVGSYHTIRDLVPYDTCSRNISHGLTYRMIRAANVAPWLSQWARQQRRQRQRAACGGCSRGLDGSVCWRASSPLRLGWCYWFSRRSIHRQSSWLSRRLVSASKSRWLPMRLAARWCMRSKKAVSPMRCCRS